jgi:hypothetical protein
MYRRTLSHLTDQKTLIRSYEQQQTFNDTIMYWKGTVGRHLSVSSHLFEPRLASSTVPQLNCGGPPRESIDPS